MKQIKKSKEVFVPLLQKVGLFCALIFILYVFITALFHVVWFFLGGHILYYVPFLPLTPEYSGEATLTPALLLLAYIVLSGIYFIKKGFKLWRVFGEVKK